MPLMPLNLLLHPLLLHGSSCCSSSIRLFVLHFSEQRMDLKRKLGDEGFLNHERLKKSRNFESYDGSMLPPGWIDCPAFGEAIGCIIPSKVSLGELFNQCIPDAKRYTPNHAIHQQRQVGQEVGLVIDLTNTNRYYPLSTWSEAGIAHVKIRCQGRDSVPDDASVDKFVSELLFLYDRGQKKLMEGNRVVFNDGLDPSSYSGKIIECSRDFGRKLWVFMRIRTDKSTPNAFNITAKDLEERVNEIIRLPIYVHGFQK